MAKSHYVYGTGGKVIFAIEDGEITVNEYEGEKEASYFVIPDCQPFQSMIDGTIINSRSTYRSHLKQHGCVEVGNDSSVMNPVRKPLSSPRGLKEMIIQVANEKLKQE